MSRKFKIGDRVIVHDETSLFHTRTQSYARGRTGVVVENRPEWVIPEDEAWGRQDSRQLGPGVTDTGRTEPFYVVRFQQTDLWPDYTGLESDTVESEYSERWLKPAGKEA
jgi:hypothetical protein